MPNILSLAVLGAKCLKIGQVPTHDRSTVTPTGLFEDLA